MGTSMAVDGVDPPGDPSDLHADAGDTCEFGSVVGDVYGRVIYFAHGAFLPPGRYRVAYVDGCMKYSASQDWAVHAYPQGSTGSDNWWLVGGSRKVVMPSGTVGFLVASGGFATFADCVAANRVLPPIEFDFGGGSIGLWLQDEPYGDNLPGKGGRSPTWRLTAVGACRPALPRPWG
jgi:hypothetical protein